MRRVIHISMISLLVLAAMTSCASRSCQKAPAADAPDITILSNRDYFPVVHQLFQEAQQSIQVMMFSARYYTEKPRFAGDIEHVPEVHSLVLLDGLVKDSCGDLPEEGQSALIGGLLGKLDRA